MSCHSQSNNTDADSAQRQSSSHGGGKMGLLRVLCCLPPLLQPPGSAEFMPRWRRRTRRARCETRPGPYMR
jgi:hypothetical protein